MEQSKKQANLYQIVGMNDYVCASNIAEAKKLANEKYKGKYNYITVKRAYNGGVRG